MKVTDHFHIEELVHREYIARYGAKKMIRVMRDYGYATPMLGTDCKFKGRAIKDSRKTT